MATSPMCCEMVPASCLGLKTGKGFMPVILKHATFYVIE